MLPDSEELAKLLARVQTYTGADSEEAAAELDGMVEGLAEELIRVRAEVIQARIDASLKMAGWKGANQVIADLRAQLADAQTRADALMANLLEVEAAQIPDPSPAAQLRRYREAQKLVDDPPKILLPWTEIHPGKWVRANLKGYVSVRANTEERAAKDEILAGYGWQLVNE